MTKTRLPLIVAVDDDLDFLEALRQMLAPTCRVETFSAPEGVPEQVEALAPDLLILDLHMPGTDGVRLCKQCRARPGLAGLPVLFLTASKDDEDFLRTVRVGADGTLNKPIGGAALRRRVREALLERRIMGPAS